MSGLIRHITAFSGAGYGVNILDAAQTSSVKGIGSRSVAVVADLPWGPPGVVTTINAAGELFESFAPSEFGSTVLNAYPALKAFIGKQFPALKIVRVAATGAAKSAFVFQSVTPDDSVTVSAKYAGAIGDGISVSWAVNADDATARDATVSVGASYSKTHKNVATIVSTLLVVTDPGDPFVDFAAAAGATIVPDAIVATSLAGGADGTASALDYTGDISNAQGLRLFYAASSTFAALFVAECPAGIIDAVNASLLSMATTENKGIICLCSVPAQDKATAQTYVSAYRADRLDYSWPRVKVQNTFDPALVPVTVDGNAFKAAVIAQVDPWVSPGGPKRTGFMSGILGLEDASASIADLDALNIAGIAPFAIVSGVGPIIRKAVTTSLASGKSKITRRRMTDYILESLAAFFAQSIEEPLDIRLSPQSLGPVTGPQIAETIAFLDGLQVTSRIGTFPGKGVGYQVDPYSGNTQAGIDANIWKIAIGVKLLSSQDTIILVGNIGESVQFIEA